MLGIIKKDFYDTFCVPKNFVSNVIGYLAVVVLAVVMGAGEYPMILFIVVAIPMTSVTVLQATMEQDEMVRFDDILLTYPLSKKQIVLAKFIDNLLYTVLNFVISLVMMLVYVYGEKVTDIRTGLLYCGMGIVVSLFVIAVCSVGFYWLGNKKGTILYLVLVVAWAIMYAVIYVNAYFVNISLDSILALGEWKLTGIAAAVSIVALALSYWGCLKLYTRRHS